MTQGDAGPGTGAGQGALRLPFAWLSLLETALLWISRLSLVVLLALIVLQVLYRALLNSPMGEVVSVTETFIMPVMVFFALGYTLATDSHIRMTVVYRLFGGRAKAAVDLGIAVISAALWIAIAWAGFHEAQFAHKLGYEVSHEIRLPLALALSVVPVGAGALALRLVLDALRQVLILAGGDGAEVAG